MDSEALWENAPCGGDGLLQEAAQTDVGEGETLTHVEVPCQGVGTGSAYIEFEHPASDYAVCGAAAVVTPGGNVSLAFNGVTAAARQQSPGIALGGRGWPRRLHL